MSARPWHKRYHSDALSGFMVLTLEERGAYQTLLDLMYDRCGPMPDNEAVLARYMGVSLRKWRSLRDSLIRHGKIRRDDAGNLVNDRVAVEIENATKRSRESAEYGSKGGRKKHENAKKDNENKENDEKRLEEKPSISEARSQKPEEEEDKPLPQSGRKYAFDGRTIRLTQLDFDRWVQAYHAIPDLRAELIGLDDWFQGPGKAKREAWFNTTSGSLGRKHQQLLSARTSTPTAYVPKHQHSDQELAAARERAAAHQKWIEQGVSQS